MDQSLYYTLHISVLICGFISSVIGFIILIYQIYQSRKTREVSICLTLSQLSMDSDLHDKFGFVWNHDFSKPLSKQEHSNTEKVIVFFELIGTIIRENYMNSNLIAGYYGALLTGCYDKLYPFIKDQRSKPYNEKYAENFEEVAKLLSKNHRVSKVNPRFKK